MTTVAEPQFQELLEDVFAPIPRDRIDEERGVIPDVKILGKVSKNGVTYTDEAMKDAIPLYEGTTVNIDHPSRNDATQERGYMEGVGFLENVRWKQDGLYGDLNYYKEHPSSKLLLERARRNPKGFGLSHNADGQYVRTKQGTVIERIRKVRSVDVVSKPATTRGLFESEAPDEPKEKTMTKFSLKQLVESHGSADEKKHLTLLEDASILDREVELEEVKKTTAVNDGFGKAITESLQSNDRNGFASLTEALKVLREGAPEPPEDPDTDKLQLLEQQVQKLSEENDRMKLEKEIKTLCESESFKPDEFQMETLSLLESADKRIKLIHTWKDSGRPERSGRKEFLEDVGSYEEERAKLLGQS